MKPSGIVEAPERPRDPRDDDLFPPPPPPVWKPADASERRRAAAIPLRLHVEFDNGGAVLEDGEFRAALVKVDCPGCHRTRAPLRSLHTRFVSAGWRWVGLAYKEPYEEWLCRCRECRTEFILTTHTPQ